TYVMIITVSDPNYVSLTETRTLQINTSDPLESIQRSNILTTIGTTLGFLVVLTYFLRKYTRS
ncbi:MAG: hypothetical protein ACW99A_23720, partial [Candidatus Kariarchaeaceae archaeon]